MQGPFSDGVFFVFFGVPFAELRTQQVQIDFLNRLFAYVQLNSLQLAASFTGQAAANGEEVRDGTRLARWLPQPPVTMTRIDFSTDPRVFAGLDDSCSQTCHTPAFVDHMGATAADRPDTAQVLEDGRPRRGILFGLARPDVSFVRADLKSNELSIGTERVMLLSIKAHATLCRVS